MLAVLSLLAGAAATASLRLLRGSLEQRAQQQLERLLVAMIGGAESESHGYLGDMGELPDTDLLQLLVRGSQTPGVQSSVDGVISGYAGPYLLDPVDTSRGFLDPWGSPVAYTPGSAQVRSAGPDRTLATDDDIVHPLAPAKVSGTITVVVRGIPLGGQPALALRSDEATVEVVITRASDNGRALQSVTYTGAPGAGVWLTDAPVHSGLHSVIVTGADATGAGGRSYVGAVAHVLVEVRGTPAFVTVTLDEQG